MTALAALLAIILMLGLIGGAATVLVAAGTSTSRRLRERREKRLAASRPDYDKIRSLERKLLDPIADTSPGLKPNADTLHCDRCQIIQVAAEDSSLACPNCGEPRRVVKNGLRMLLTLKGARFGDGDFR